MSRAFVREDVDPPERSGRKRSASGLPPGATNYMTVRGAKRLQAELKKLREMAATSDRILELERILASAEIVDPPDQLQSVSFGTTVTVCDNAGSTVSYTIVGVDELDFEPRGVSWISPLGKALLASEVGDRITLDNGRPAKIAKVEYRPETLTD